MPRCIIVSNGVITDYSFYQNKLENDDYIICADGGIKHILNLNRIPDLWLGDFDSCKFSQIINEHPDLECTETVKLNPVKDVTDTHYACTEALKRGYTDIILWGASGGRADHMLSNIHLLEFLNDKGLSAKIQDEKNTIHLCTDTIQIIKERKYLSLIPLDSSVLIECTKGLKYPLKNYNLTREISIGVSNEITDSSASVSVKKGKLLVIESDD